MRPKTSFLSDFRTNLLLQNNCKPKKVASHTHRNTLTPIRTDSTTNQQHTDTCTSTHAFAQTQIHVHPCTLKVNRVPSACLRPTSSGLAVQFTFTFSLTSW